MAHSVLPYKPPAWASSLMKIPTSRIKLAMTPTPIQEWKLPGVPDDFKVLIKRDDMTGGVLSGNKIRKLEFLLGDVLQKSCRHVISNGALQSNHCRTLAAACAQIGLQSHLFLRSEITDTADLRYDGNLLIAKLCGAQMYLIPTDSSFKTHIQPRMEKLAQQIEDDTGEHSYIIPTGGSDIVGLWGYIQCLEEIRQQGVEFDDLVCVIGSGGTAAGLSIANYLCGSPYRCHGVRIRPTPTGFEELVDDMLSSLSIPGVSHSDIINIYDEYIGRGYGISEPHVLEFIAETAAQTGVLLDTTYTGKAAHGLRNLMRNRPEMFKGRRVMFIHSDGGALLHSAGVRESLLPLLTKSQVSVLPPV